MKSSIRSWFIEQIESKTALNDGLQGLSNLSKLTVIVPSFERQEYLLRQIVYWKDSKVNLVIVDGSEQSLAEGVLYDYLQIANVTYYHLNAPYSERLKFAITKINTKYTVLLGDDEFLLKTGLISVIDQLENNPDIEACIGQSRKFYCTNDIVTYQTGYPHTDYHILQDDVSERLNAAMHEYTAATCYAVIRSETWAKSYGNMVNWGSPYTAEMQQAFYVYIAGKLTTSKKIYWLRSSENAPINTRTFDRTFSFESWWSASKFDSEKQLFVELLSAEIHDMYSEQTKRAIITKAVSLFINAAQSRRAPKNPYEKHRQKLISTLGRVARLSLPHSLFSKLLEWQNSCQDFIGRVFRFSRDRGVSAVEEGLSELDPDQQSELVKIEGFIRHFVQAKNTA